MFPLKQEVLHDVALNNHLECLAGPPDALQPIGVDTLLLVEDQSGFDPFWRWHYVRSAPTDALQFLQNTETYGEKEGIYWAALTEASSRVILSPPRSEVERTASSPPFLANSTRS